MKRNVKRLIAGGLVIPLLAAVLFESVTRAKPQQRRRSGAGARSARQVRDLFASNCARCHGADGSGDTPLGHTYNAPDFTDPEWWQEHSAITSSRSFQSIVTRGKDKMPAFGKKLTGAEIESLANYVRRFRNRK